MKSNIEEDDNTDRSSLHTVHATTFFMTVCFGVEGGGPAR